MDNKNTIKKNKFSFKILKWVIVFFLINYSSLTSIKSYSQEQFSFEGEGFVQGILSSENMIPFWFYKNTSTRLGEFTNGLAYGKFNTVYALNENHRLEAGVSLMIRDGVSQEFQRENLFLEYNNPWLKATFGAKERPVFYNGLSSTNGNMIWSLNARPLPGIIIEANNPLKISNTFSIDWGIAHYMLNDDRHVTDTRVHYKRLGLLVKINEKHLVHGQLQHFAQWAGTSPEFGQLPNDFEAYFDVFFARSASEEAPGGEIQNSVGNHLGSYLLRYQYKGSIGGLSLYHEHPFDDGSGTGFSNFPDGVWGITFTSSNSKIIKQLLYEYIDTTDQSGHPDSPGNSGNDNYFNNAIYKSGWSYEGNSIGLPLFITETSMNSNNRSINFINRVRAHHLAMGGDIVNNVNWVFKTTILTNYGTYLEPLDPNLENWYNYLTIAYQSNNWGSLSVQFGVDTSNYIDTIFGGGLSYQYKF